jgi:hypothetical protein
MREYRHGQTRVWYVLTVLAAGALCDPPALPAEDWPQFRGPNASAVAGSTYPLPVEFSQTEKMKWKAHLGDGIGSPIVAAGRVFVTAMVADQKFGVFCFDAAQGDLAWRREFDTGKLPRITPPNSHASSTPASDENESMSISARWACSRSTRRTARRPGKRRFPSRRT